MLRPCDCCDTATATHRSADDCLDMCWWCLDHCQEHEQCQMREDK